VDSVEAAWAALGETDVTGVVGFETYTALVNRCPEERALVHGDFGANNVLVNQGSVSGVLDWEQALVGDPLYDVANTRFWATYLPCMDMQAAHFDRTLAGVPGYRDRVLCYALRIGIEEAREAGRGGDASLAAWATARCRQLIAAYAAA
jgi:hygromycin-B 4-O-kinase